MKINRNISLFIALFFLGLFFSKAQSSDSLTFRLTQDSTDINVFIKGNINHNTYWKQQILSNNGGPVLDLHHVFKNRSYNFKTNAYNSYIPLKKEFVYSTYYKFTQLEYRPTLDDGQYVTALHTQAYNDFSFGLFYQKLVSEGEFQLENKDHINTEFRIAYHPENKNYRTKFTLSHNVSKTIENGGFQSDSIFLNETTPNNKVVPVRLNKAQNEINNTEFDWLNEFWFVTKDSLSFKLNSKTTYHSKSENYRDINPLFFSTSTNNPSKNSYYPTIYKDSTQTNDSIIFRSIKQRFSLDTKLKSHDISPFIEIEKNFFNLGYGDSDINLFKSGIQLNAFNNRFIGEFIYKNQSDLSSGLELNLNASISKKLKVKLNYDQRAPDLFYRKYESNHFRWDNNFERSNTLQLESELELIHPNTHLKLFYNQIENHIYLNENALPTQSAITQIIGGIELNSLIKVGKFTFNTELLYQKIGEGDIGQTSSIIQLPSFIGRIKIAYKQKMFGEALVQPGIQLNYNSKYYAPKYMAPLASFYLQRETKIGGALLMDIFVNVKVSNFTFYAMYNNLLQSVFERENFTSPHYIGPIQQFNFGVRWNFYDK